MLGYGTVGIMIDQQEGSRRAKGTAWDRGKLRYFDRRDLSSYSGTLAGATLFGRDPSLIGNWSGSRVRSSSGVWLYT